MPTMMAFPAEFRFVEGDEPGIVAGRASAFNLLDWHGDKILPGAFDETLAEHRANGTSPAMFIEHSGWKPGGDPLPIGRWTDISTDDKGLLVKGKLSALNTDHGKRIHELLKDGVIGGISIAFNVPPGGATIGRKAGEAKRTINKLELLGIDLVRNPSQAAAQITEIRSMVAAGDHQAACDAICAAMQLHKDSMAGSNSPNAEQRAKLMQHLQDAHQALTGQPMPAGMKAAPTLRELQDMLKREFDLSNSQAIYIVEHGLKTLPHRDDVGSRLTDEQKAAELRAAEMVAAAAVAEAKSLAERQAADEQKAAEQAAEQRARQEARSELAGALSGFSLLNLSS